MQKSFVVVIPSFNNERWCRENLESVLSQSYPLFRVIYIDDLSTDETARMVSEYLAENARAHLVTFHRNETRVGPLSNIDTAVRSCDPNDIVVLVDGDDFLAHREVLSRLNTIYQDPDVWLTWGQFTRVPQGTEGFCSPIPEEVVSANAFRDYPFVSSHLRTFYAGLYHRIRLVDVKDGDGQFFTIAGDVAQMFPMQEMAGPHGRFVAEVLYKYNRENPLSDDKVDRAGQIRTEREIRGKARYGRLRGLSGTSAPSEFCIATGVGRSLFGVNGPLPEGDQRRRPFRQMRSVVNRLGYTVREAQNLAEIETPHHIAVFDIRPEEQERLAEHPRDLLTLFLWKDPIAAPFNFERKYHDLFSRIYTWSDDLVDNKRYFKLHFPFARPMIDEVVAFENRRLCTLIASRRESDHPDELYSEERKVAEFFAEAAGDSFELFGWGWDPIADRNYGGMISARRDYLRRYRFSFCYETVRGWNGLVTGKIFDSFEAGCVPVYWGAPNIAASIPADCFIAREAFASNAELFAFLNDMPAGVHEGYLARIRSFLSSERAIPYSAGPFVRTFVSLVGRRMTTRDRSLLGHAGAERAVESGEGVAGFGRDRE